LLLDTAVAWKDWRYWWTCDNGTQAFRFNQWRAFWNGFAFSDIVHQIMSFYTVIF